MPDPERSYISQITLPSGNTYYLRDSEAKNRLDQLTKALYWIGVTTTQLVDNVTTSPDIVVGGETKTATAGGVAQYNSEEFVYNGTTWQSLGSAVSDLGNMAYADTASASYTPAGSVSGTVSGTAVTVGSTTVSEVTNAGSMPTYSVSSEVLTITAGAIPTVSSKTVGASGSATVTQGTFSANLTGTAATITVTPDTP